MTQSHMKFNHAKQVSTSSQKEIDPFSNLSIVEKIRSVSELEVSVLHTEHANCDSLPLRYGIYFTVDAKIKLTRVEFRHIDKRYQDRFHVEAWITAKNGEQLSGHFVLGQRSGFENLVLVTAWRHHIDTEYHLSELMTALRKEGFLTPSMLTELHPLYASGKLRTAVDLTREVAVKLSANKVAELNTIASRATVAADQAIAQRDAAIAKEKLTQASLASAQCTMADMSKENAALKLELEEERLRQGQEQERAKRNGDQVKPFQADILVDVLEKQLIGRSLCTVLVMGNKEKRYMKLSTFDPDGSVTQKAIKLKGRRVVVTGWDPIGNPGLWTKKGYFRNVYAST